MNHKVIRHLVVLAVIALCGLMTVQIVWFKQAYDLQKRQFTEKANSALNFTARQLNDTQEGTPSVRQTSANTFRVQINNCINDDSLRVHLQKALSNSGTAGNYDVAVNDCSNKDKLLTYNNLAFADSKELFSNTSKQEDPCYYLNVTFNDSPKTLMQEMWFWVFASVCCLLVFVFFAYSLYALLKEKRLSDMKKDFINNMTHELKTPIANIAVASEMLKNPPLSMSIEKMKHYADIIQKENKRLEEQVERVLTMAFLEDNHFDLKREKIDINALLEGILTNFSPRVTKRNGHIQFENKAAKPIIEADKLHLTNVIFSLLDNADKYSPDKPMITLETKNTPHGLRLTISDKGIGIVKDAQKMVFDKFYRVQTGDIHDVKGFGLGLTYAKMIVEAHGGLIQVDSQPFQGSRFSIDLVIRTSQRTRGES
jgi:two-component system, OmpR family, phosphate regulon sensor histidine kinase PhoR